jgi:hypothetical protein
MINVRPQSDTVLRALLIFSFAAADFQLYFSTAQATVEQFLRSIPTSSSHEYHTPSFAENTLTTSRAIALATDIRLHFQLASTSPVALEKSLSAAREILQGVSLLVPEDYLYLEPIVAVRFERLATLLSETDAFFGVLIVLLVACRNGLRTRTQPNAAKCFRHDRACTNSQ